jgi:cytidylate kinase
MYRVVTLAVLRESVDVDNEIGVSQLTSDLEMDILPADSEGDGRHYTVMLGGSDVTWEIRSAEVDLNVSQISSYAGVRDNLVRRQRAIADHGRVVMVGRDIGTVVLPNAPLKLFITATQEERARRRWSELKERKLGVTYEFILSQIDRRDQLDGTRKISPMRPASDAIIIDTTNLTPQEVVWEILSLNAFQQEG